MTLSSGTTIDGYEIIETIGTGAMSTVYLGKKDNDFFAVKELKSQFASPDEEEILINAFHREAELLFHISHPGIPRLYKRFTINKKFYIVMEYIKGTDLEKIIKNSQKPFDEEKTLKIGIQLCEIFFYLHNLSPEPVIYRDLKPSNIIITNEGMVKLIDFGVARRYDPKKDRDTVRLGTPGYAAPEQCRDRGQSVPQSDIYAIGVLLHQLLTLYDPSATPFRLPKLRTLNPQVSEELEWIINKAINLDKKERYLDTGLFMDELIDYYEEHFGEFISYYRKELPYLKEKSPVMKRSLIQTIIKMNVWNKISIAFGTFSILWILLILFDFDYYIIDFLPYYCGAPLSPMIIISINIYLYYQCHKK